MSVREEAIANLRDEQTKLNAQGKTQYTLQLEADNAGLPLSQRYDAGRTLRYIAGLKQIIEG